MRDLDEDSNGCSWPLHYENKTMSNGQYYNSFFPRVIADAYSLYDKDGLKRTMLEHEAIFQNQVSELHRLYRIQRNLMDEVKNKELHKSRIPIEPLSSSSLLASQIKSEVARKWHIPNFPVPNSVCGRPSTFGAEDVHSPICSMKGSSIHAGKNGVNPTDVEVLECRPAKVRRKLFDLEVPADEYIDTEEVEQFRDDTTAGLSSYLLNENGKFKPDNGGKRFHNDVGKTGCQRDASRSDAGLRGKNSLPDLNEPIKIEEPNGSSYSHSVVHDPYHGGHGLSAKPKSELLCLPKDISVNSHHPSDRSHVFEAGQSKSNSKFISPNFQPQKLSVPYQQVQGLFDTANDPPAFLLTDPVNPWSHLASYSQKPSSSLTQKFMSVQTRPFLCSQPSHGNFGEKWPASSNSRLNPGFGRDLPNRNGIHYGSSSGSKELAIHFLSTNYDYMNGSNVDKGVFEQFSTYGSTKPYNCSTGVDMKSASDVNLNVVLLNRSSNEPVTERGPHIGGVRNHEDHLPGLSWLQVNPAYKNEAIRVVKDFNVRELNFSQSSSKQSTDKNETRIGFDQIFTQNVESVPSSNNANASRSEISEFLRGKKILGVPISEKHYVSKDESSFTSPYVYAPQQSEGEAKNKGRNVLLDINLPCDVSQDIVAENSAIEKGEDMMLSSFRLQIDLNSCADEEEASFMHNVPSTCMRMTGEMDLETSLIPDPEDVIHQEELMEKAHELPLESSQSGDDCLHNKLMKTAAEAIVAISSSDHCSHLADANFNASETSMTNPLSWFVETVASFGEDLESKFETILRDEDGGRDESLEEIDYFESMILQLAETKEEDFMPQPIVPENFKVEETGTTSLLTTRTRKGQGRRGRQRRDFQRDILPGLSSLSRFEVTQDLHTFEGLMKATGHSWQSGLTRRNSNRGGCGRGRRRSVTTSPPVSEAAITHTPLMQQLYNIELGLGDRSLTGWGKTTRRPRRQRCSRR